MSRQRLLTTVEWSRERNVAARQQDIGMTLAQAKVTLALCDIQCNNDRNSAEWLPMVEEHTKLASDKAQVCMERSLRYRDEGSPMEAYMYDLRAIEYRRLAFYLDFLTRNPGVEVTDEHIYDMALAEAIEDEDYYRVMVNRVGEAKNVQWYSELNGTVWRSDRTGAHTRGELLQGYVAPAGKNERGVDMWSAAVIDVSGTNWPPVQSDHYFYSRDDAMMWCAARL
ncbi:MAG TPA: hypothetical protein VIY48_00165 [Candidatus Paceibacterota bacterium]